MAEVRRRHNPGSSSRKRDAEEPRAVPPTADGGDERGAPDDRGDDSARGERRGAARRAAACLILASSIFAARRCLSTRGDRPRPPTLASERNFTATATEHMRWTEDRSDLRVFRGDVDPNRQLLSAAFRVRNPNSDLAYLKHCNLSAVNDTVFFEWIGKITGHKSFMSRFGFFEADAADVKDELTLQGLEVFSKALGLCNFSLYRPTVPDDAVGLAEAGNVLKRVPRATSVSKARLAYVIIAFKDAEHLEELIRVVHMPHHLIIVHLERRTPEAFATKVNAIAKGYHNVVVLQYGSITYPTDQLSYINLQIMRWLLFDLKLVYDHHVTMGASAYPLMAAKDMAQLLAKEPSRVRLGILTFERKGGGSLLCKQSSHSFGLTYSRGLGKKDRMIDKSDRTNLIQFFSQIRMEELTSLDGFPSDLKAFLPRSELQEKCDTKSNSGNTAIFDYDAVRSLLSSPDAMEFLSHFKYVGGCCAEESSWYGALKIIGRGDEELKKPGAMWQSWPCDKTMRNSVLRMGNETCYSVIDTAGGWGEKLFRGDAEIRKELIDARKRGHLFARKIDASVQESVALRDWIGRTFFKNNSHSGDGSEWSIT